MLEHIFITLMQIFNYFWSIFIITNVPLLINISSENLPFNLPRLTASRHRQSLSDITITPLTRSK